MRRARTFPVTVAPSCRREAAAAQLSTVEAVAKQARFLVFIVITRQELTRACPEKGTELIQPIADSLFALPSGDDPNGPIVLLPQPTTKFPREKQVSFCSFQLPKRKPPTKWELFAKIKD
ncbi:hypothetical protein B296_00011922 [Ensete ventricosum]|uniref:Ribosome biogenesis regulatory protein n=1 Tax=Ensete ventricosum TaxID=4639 RepID=A0A426ZUK5_ENSVE|nr:hypothetical protein B296_00011922 [Ensete ventricosum]